MTTSKQKPASHFTNAMLYSIESITGLLFSVLSISLIARHFGPEIFSRFSVVNSISTIFIVFVTLGLDQFIIRELVRNKNDVEYITSATIGLFAGWIAYATAIFIYYSVFKNVSRDLILIINVIIGTFFLKVIFIKSYLQALNKPRSIAISSVISRLFSVAYLLIGTYCDFSFDAMMIYVPLQAIVMTAGMSINQPDFFNFIQLKHFNFQRLRSISREASPVFVSTILYYFYNQSDILIMSSLLDANSVGIYSASIRIIPQAAFIGYVLVATFYADMDAKLLTDKQAFETYVKSVLTVQFAVGILMATVTCLSSGLIIQLLYGPRYADSARVLAIACWSWVFIIPAALYSRLLIMLGHVKYELIKMIVVAPIIVALNYLVISRVGILGSALVYVFSYFLVDFFIYLIFQKTRYLGKLGLEAITDIFTKPGQTWHLALKLFTSKHAS